MRGQFSLIADDVRLGRDVAIYNFVNLYGCEIGDNTKIGSFVEIKKAFASVVAVRYQVTHLSAKA